MFSGNFSWIGLLHYDMVCRHTGIQAYRHTGIQAYRHTVVYWHSVVFMHSGGYRHTIVYRHTIYGTRYHSEPYLAYYILQHIGTLHTTAYRHTAVYLFQFQALSG